MADEQNTHVFKAISPEGGVVQIEVEIPKRIRDAAQKAAQKVPPIISENSTNGFLGRLRFLFSKIRNLPFSPTKDDTQRVIILAAIILFLSVFVIFPLWLGLSGGLSSDKDIIKSNFKESIIASGKKPYEAKTPAERKRIEEEEKRKQEKAQIKAEQEAKIKAEEEKKKQEEAARIKAEEERLRKEEEERNRPKIIAEAYKQAALNYFLQDYYKAKENIDKCIELDPKNPIYRGWGILIRSKIPQKSGIKKGFGTDSYEKEGYVAALTTAPREPQEFFARGVSYYQLGQNSSYYESAVDDLMKCRDNYRVGCIEEKCCGYYGGCSDGRNYDSDCHKGKKVICDVTVPICYYFLSLTYTKLGNTEAADYNLQKFKFLEQGLHLEVFNRDRERRYGELEKIREQDGKTWTEQERQIIQHVESCLSGEASCDTSQTVETLYQTGKSLVKYFGWIILHYSDDFHLRAMAVFSREKDDLASWYLMEEALYCRAQGSDSFYPDLNRHWEVAIQKLFERKAVNYLCGVALYADNYNVRSFAVKKLAEFKDVGTLWALRKIAKFDSSNDSLAESIIREIEAEKQLIKYSP